MRVISGIYRGLNLASFSGEEIRPTADRVKESLFNIIFDRVAGARILDLFCGSGSLGIECLSRRAEKVWFNDLSKDSVAVLNKNLAKLSGEHDYKITVGDFRTFLNSSDGGFDIIFIDPPYRFEYGYEALKIIAKRSLLSEGGVAVYEWDKQPQDLIEGLKLVDVRKYGRTYLGFYGYN